MDVRLPELLELPKSEHWGFVEQSWLYDDEQLRAYARAYARAAVELNRPVVDGLAVKVALAEWDRLEGHQPDDVRMRAALLAALGEAGSA